jgi:hypothetical protein
MIALNLSRGCAIVHLNNQFSAISYHQETTTASVVSRGDACIAPAIIHELRGT